MKGLEDFRKAFGAYRAAYVLIGGAACDVWLAAAGLRSRATKDLDVVLIIEALDAGFIQAFRSYVDSRGYSCASVESGKKRFYRFEHPAVHEAPAMIELFSRGSDILPPGLLHRKTRIVVDRDVTSLSAILLDDAYYGLVRDLRQEREGLSLLSPLGIIPLKACAYLDLAARKAAGEAVDEADIRKHRSDIFRLLTIVDPETRLNLPPSISGDLRRFVEGSTLVPFDWKVFAKSLGLPTAGLEERILGTLVAIYGISE